jgi:hypothetical protein
MESHLRPHFYFLSFLAPFGPGIPFWENEKACQGHLKYYRKVLGTGR